MSDQATNGNGIDSDRYQDVPVNTDEEMQDLLHGEMVILQKKDGYRFSVDPILLTSFVQLKDGDKVVDLGTGSGIMPLILARREAANVEFVGLEVQKTVADMAERSVAANQMDGSIVIQQGDIRHVRKHFKSDQFDVVISNPPYIPAGQGKVNPSDDKAVARHEIKITLSEVVAAARFLVKPRGRVYFVYPVKRLIDLIGLCRQHKLEPRQIQFVHANQLAGAKLAMVEAIRDAGVDLKVCKPMIVYNMDGTYTEDVAQILNEQDLVDAG
jgi:tRNA1(Val) A37 N6-methylase TrmN6